MSTTSFPHVLPILSLLERGVAVGDTPEPWESSEVGVDVVMFHLEAARTIAHHGGVYRSNAEAKLQGRTPMLGRSHRRAALFAVTAPLLPLTTCVCAHKVRPLIPPPPNWFSV